ncbi:uncharacterized protein ATC70_002386 [Mucor velutinosus]|uniref:Uncharacterized protein n=1 Tax=Mucor velutinosus TaxID=708070 RepID=A0AAN7DDF0_9FUNG|nr:hypothetical protein ATC70_002386 [Mucor velutinosus]
MATNLQGMDMNQLQMILNQLQEQLTSVTARVNEHDGLLARLDTLEKENSELKKLLQDKDLAIQKLQGAVSGHVVPSGSSRPTAVEGSTLKTTTGSMNTKATKSPSYANVAKAAATLPDPATEAKQAKKRLAIGRAFTTAARKGPQGYQYVYIGRSKKIARSEVRSLLRKAGVDLGRVLDICFPASDVIGILVHVQYVQDFTALLEACEAEFFFDFDPLDPANIADPKYDSLTLDQRTVLIMEFTATRCLQTLAFLRPLNVSGVGKYFVEQGWICDEDLSVSVGDAIQRFAKKEPKRANFLFRRKINADSANEDSAMEQ